ncbi:MAG: D-alanyl-D-alanine carboxypeptidase/D-alanyl-D-alanine endopeptidase [Betaproteobacteria bacterium]
MRLAAVLVLIACGALFPAPGAAQSRLPEPVAQALARAKLPETSVAFYVHEIGADRPLVAYGDDRVLNPASTMKLVTTYAGLELLGPAYAWNTDAYGSGPLVNGVLNGDLILKGHGDPKLTIENFWLLLRNLRARGVREIRGDLILDRSFFSREEFDASRFDDQPTRPYNTGPDALLVNFKAVTVQFIPDPEARTVRLLIEPLLPHVTVVNSLKLTEGPCGYWLSRVQIDAQGSADAARLAFSGSYAADCGEQARSFSVLGHREYVGGLFSVLWQELGGVFAGAAREGAAPPGARLLASAKSHALSEIVRDINKYSNNVMARQLFLTLGALGEGPPASTEKARRTIRQWLAAKGLSFPELVLENGSGLSRIERITARHMGQLLLAAYNSPVMPELAASLPLTAVDGTMRKRLSRNVVAGQAHIKTGSLANVRSIAGYVLDSRGRRNVVVFFVNHANAGNAQPVQDALLQWVYQRDDDACCAPRRR